MPSEASSESARHTAAPALDLSLIVPCYDEAGHLRDSVEQVVEVLDDTRWTWEIVFVDDGSRDDTRALIAEICAAEPRCRFIFHERNRGRGAAVKTGFTASRGRVAGFLDIDLEVHARYIPSLVGAIEHDGVDVATGRRYYLLRQTGGLLRIVLSWVYRRLIALWLNIGLSDTETGCKFFRRETAGGVVLESESDGWFWDTEVMARAALRDLEIREMPVLFLRRMDKRSTVRVWQDSWDYLRALVRFCPKVGLGWLDRSPLYLTGVGYDAAMRLLYRGQYRETYAAVARLIPDGASVVDVCCGTARLERDFLRARGIHYRGLDMNGHLVMAAQRAGARVRWANVLTDEIPAADYVTMCSSLYHFHDRAPEVLAKLRAAAREAVVISEPVHNLSQVPIVGPLASRLTNPGGGEFEQRYDLESFRRFAEAHGADQFVHAPGTRNAIAVFRTRPAPG
jgi:glycosyltransferase involved in cell wall biosynthesis